MEKFEYRNSRGASITIDYIGPYFIESYDGLTSAEIIPIANKGYNQQGYSYQKSLYGARIINLYFYVHDNTMQGFYAKKRSLAALFNPLLGEGTLTYTNDYGSKKISAVVTYPPSPVTKMGSLQIFNVELTAHNPFWTDVAEQALKMGDYQGGLTFPFNNEDEPYMQFAQKGDLAYINNIGDIETPIRAEFRGEAINPILTLENTGELIKVNTSLAVGEKLIIDTAYGNKTVWKEAIDGTRESAYNLITNDTSFFHLPEGESTLTFGSDGGEPEVYIYWYNRYVGV